MSESLKALLAQILEAVQKVAAFLYVRWATQQEVENRALKDLKDTKAEQLDISSKPADDPAAVRGRMRDGQL